MSNHTVRLFCEFYQFYLYDSEYDHGSDERLAWTDENRQEHGYLSTERAIYVSTVADLNDHRVRVYIDEKRNAEYERVFSRKISIDSGVLVLSGVGYEEEERSAITLSAGLYSVEICGNAIGKDALTFDPKAEEEEDDEQFFKHDEYEHYDIFLNRVSDKA